MFKIRNSKCNAIKMYLLLHWVAIGEETDGVSKCVINVTNSNRIL